MDRETFDKAKLEEIGFREIAQWQLSGQRLSYCLINPGPESDALCAFPNALYAFTCGQTILYVGKTTKGIRIRFAGYCNPGRNQVTNQKCHEEIKSLLRKNASVSISVFSGNQFLRYDIFEINLAAGLEDSLIKTLRPRWNGKFVSGEFVSETEEIEAEAVLPESIAAANVQSVTGRAEKGFEVKLGKTYYGSGFINTGTTVSDAIGKHGEPMLIRLGSESHPGVESRIDRKANVNGTPRIYGGARVARWFQDNFRLNDTVIGRVLTPNQILLVKKISDVGREDMSIEIALPA
ncbi:hypothetical protein DB347_07085 [Opitutaceae bacterium EW11]|nr:hypothetical protein DB347_07085 [Opitutaceae bacterium EW11]